jgi:hypothetical protein
MATLRNLAIGALRIAGHTNIAAGIRAVGRNVTRAISSACDRRTLTLTLSYR